MGNLRAKAAWWIHLALFQWRPPVWAMLAAGMALLDGNPQVKFRESGSVGYDVIGITEGADPTVNLKWQSWVRSGKPAILITKMPRLLYPMLEGNENVIIHCTITGLGGTNIEPGIDPPMVSLLWYHRFCTRFGSERVVLRIDPIIPWAYEYVLPGKLVWEAWGRVRISFIDLYPHVRVRFGNANIHIPQMAFHLPPHHRRIIWRDLGEPEVCSEPGLPCTPCVGEEDCRILGVQPSNTRRGQRQYCACLSNKKELCVRPPKCTYGCLYCYWKDEEVVGNGMG